MTCYRVTDGQPYAYNIRDDDKISISIMKFSIYKKLVVSLFMIPSLVMSARAQVQFGVKGGLSASELLTSGNPSILVEGTTQHLRYFPITSINGGAFALIPFSKKWSLQPEVMFSMQGATGKPEMDYLVTATEDYRFSYLNVPILVKLKLPVGFFAETGPQLGLLLHAKIEETTVGATSTFNYNNVKSQFKSTDLSWVLGAGYCSPINLGFDIRYNLGLSNINQASAGGMSSYPIPDGTIKNSVFQAGIFYIFGKPRFNPPPPSE